MKGKKIVILLAVVALGMASCKKEYLDTNNPESISDEMVFGKYEYTLHVLNGVLGKYYDYPDANMQGDGGVGSMSFHARLDMMGDDVINSIPAYYMQYYRWTAVADEKSSFVSDAWDLYYDKIAVLNKLLKKVADVSDATDEQKAFLEGEVRILRAYSYHQLVQMFGKRYVKGGANSDLGVVIRDENSKMDPKPRATVKECYDFIVSDLVKGLELFGGLSNGFKPSPAYTNNWVGKTAAYAIAARVYQSMSDWEMVEKMTQKSLDAAVTEGYSLVKKPEELLNGFNDATCSEWIWGYVTPTEQWKSWNGFFKHFSYSVEGWNDVLKFAVNRDLFEGMGANDCRRKWWVCQDLGDKIPEGCKYYFNNQEFTGASVKFNTSDPSNPSCPGDNLMMRLAVVYYMRAEALARLGKDGDAQKVLNDIMVTRDPDYSAATFTGDELIAEILRNKRIDLWLEGERFFDMKRLCIGIDRLKSKNRDIVAEVAPQRLGTFVDRNSGKNALYIPKNADSPNWEFMIPRAELDGANTKVVQNPQHIAVQ